MHRHKWVVLIPGWIGSALCVVRPSKLHRTTFRYGLMRQTCKTDYRNGFVALANCGSLAKATRLPVEQKSNAAMAEVARSGSESRISPCSTSFF